MKKTAALLLVIFLTGNIYAAVKKKYESKLDKVPTKKMDGLYEKTRLIMSKEERAIYKHLPDSESRKEFMNEFWEKRDPTPDNDQNEALLSFRERIAYANRWFREYSKKDSGWETQRGRILLQLGIPDRREFGERPYLRRDGSLASTKRLPMEIWYYYRYKLSLIFSDRKGFGKFRLERVPATLLTAIDLAKISVLDNSKNRTSQFRFKCKYKKNSIHISIPLKNVSFDESGSNIKASFNFRIYKYLNFKRMGVVKFKKEINEKNSNILSKKNISFDIPLDIKKGGKYFFDIIGEDELGRSKSRDSCKSKD